VSQYTLITAPIIEPVSLAEAKLQLNIPTAETFWDDYITSLITTARQTAEQLLWRGINTQTWDLYLDYNEVKEFLFMTKCPLQSITYIKYYDADNVLTTLSTDDYYTDLIGEPARVHITTMPTVYERMNAMNIRFVCGWTSAALTPYPIKQAIKLIVAHLFEHRESVVFTDKPTELPMGVLYLLNPYSLNFFYNEA